MAVKKVAPKKLALISGDVAQEQAATKAAWEALRLLSPGARSRALNWLDAWAREESDPRDTGRYPY